MRMASPAPSILLSSLKMRPRRSSLGACGAHRAVWIEWCSARSALVGDGGRCALCVMGSVGRLKNLGRLQSLLVLLAVTAREQRDRRNRNGAGDVEHKPREQVVARDELAVCDELDVARHVAGVEVERNVEEKREVDDDLEGIYGRGHLHARGQHEQDDGKRDRRVEHQHEGVQVEACSEGAKGQQLMLHHGRADGLGQVRVGRQRVRALRPQRVRTLQMQRLRDLRHDPSLPDRGAAQVLRGTPLVARDSHELRLRQLRWRLHGRSVLELGQHAKDELLGASLLLLLGATIHEPLLERRRATTLQTVRALRRPLGIGSVPVEQDSSLEGWRSIRRCHARRGGLLVRSAVHEFLWIAAASAVCLWSAFWGPSSWTFVEVLGDGGGEANSMHRSCRPL